MKIRHWLWKIAKRLCDVREGENIGNSRLLPHIAILLGNDKWYWKLWLIKNRRGPSAHAAYMQCMKNEYFDIHRRVWRVGPLEIPEELIYKLTQGDIDLANTAPKEDFQR